MRVLSKSSALLADYEVLSLLKEMEAEQLAARKAGRQNGAKAKGDSETPAELSLEEEESMMRAIPENIRTIQFELIKTLVERHRGCAQQTPEFIEHFLDELKAAGFAAPPGPRGRRQGILTKAEQLQILNHAPQLPVELYTIIDSMEERLEEEDITELLGIIQRCLPVPASPYDEMAAAEAAAADARRTASLRAEAQAQDDEDEAMNDASIVEAGDDFIHEGRTEAIDDEKEDAD